MIDESTGGTDAPGDRCQSRTLDLMLFFDKRKQACDRCVLSAIGYENLVVLVWCG